MSALAELEKVSAAGVIYTRLHLTIGAEVEGVPCGLVCA